MICKIFIFYLCVIAQLVAPGQGSLVYKYTTEVKLSVAHGQFDLKNDISADVHIKNLGDCNYALQVKFLIVEFLFNWIRYFLFHIA